ncbi:MAG: hypothetical protein V3T23_03160 [Nitrososphaerales archaeon]
MARPSSATVSEIKPRELDLRGYEEHPSTDGVIEAQSLLEGMITAIPRAKRPVGSSPSIINGRIRDDWVGRRGGNPNYITKPDSNAIIRMISFRGEENQDWIVRVSNGALHATPTTASWTSFSGTPYSFFSRTDYAQLLGNLYITNLTKKIIQIDFTNQSYAEISDSAAPKAKFITAFAERILAGYIQDPADGLLPFGLKWSVNSAPTTWTGTGSGSENLIQSPSDTGDEITGLFSYGNICVIFRERTIWHITRQPFAIAPFRFDAVITNQGCDMPYSIARVSDEQGKTTGFIFADNQTKGIFSYTPGSRPVRIAGGVNVEEQLFTTMTDPSMAVGAYDGRNQEYHIGLPISTTNIERLGKFWVVALKFNPVPIMSDDGPVCTSIDVVSDVGTPTMIDDLTGTIDALSGTIDELSAFVIQNPIVLKGDTAGQSTKEDLATKGTHTFTWTSQDLGSISKRRVLKILTIAMSASASGNTILQWSSDLTTWTTIKTQADVSALVKIGFKRQVGSAGDVIHWRVTSLATDFRMTEWWVRLMELGEKHIL